MKWRLPGVVTLSILLHVALIVGLLREERVPPLVMAGNAGGAVAFSVLSASHGQPAAAASSPPAAMAANPSSALPAGVSAAQPTGAVAGESARPLATEVTLPDPEIALPRAREAARDAGLKAAASRQKNAQPVAPQQTADPERRTARHSESQAAPVKPERRPLSDRRADAEATRQETPAVTPSTTRQTTPAATATPPATRQSASVVTQAANRQAERSPRAVAEDAQPSRQPTAVRPSVSEAAIVRNAAAQNAPTTSTHATAQANAVTGGQTAAASGSSRQAAGSSDSGNAARGAGSSNNQNFRALHRRVDYPQRAKALGVEGRVRIKFDVTASGTVTNVRILSETPVGVFAQSVTKDIARWRYQTQAAVNDQVASIVFKLNGQVALEN